MSREIKFRAWIDITKCEKIDDRLKGKAFIDSRNHWGSLVEPFCMKMFWQTIENYSSWKGVFIDVQQYTGLKDKNGKEIYEGDIVKYFTSKEYRWKVYYSGLHAAFEPFGFHVYAIKQLWDKGQWTGKSDCEIIGNIYEHPDLLK